MRRTLWVMVGILALAGNSSSAHHSYAGFYKPTERTVQIEGDLQSIRYANPHVVMKIRDAHATVYTVTWQAATWVERRSGVTKTTFAVGDHLIIIGAPSRDASSTDVTQVRDVRRPRDNWHWTDGSQFAKPS
jgi:hypothetical protein